MNLHKKLYGVVLILLSIIGIAGAAVQLIQYAEGGSIITGALSIILLILGIWMLFSKRNETIVKLETGAFLVLAAAAIALLVFMLVDGIQNLSYELAGGTEAQYAQVPALVTADVKKIAEQNGAYPLLLDSTEIVSKVQFNDVIKEYGNKVTVAGRGYVKKGKDGKQYVSFWTNGHKSGVEFNAEYTANDEQMSIITQENNPDVDQDEFDAQGGYHYVYGKMIITAEITDVIDSLFSSPVFKGTIVDIYAK